MSKSSIEWTEHTWNPVAGCTWASPGCDHCYAASMTRRLAAMAEAEQAVGKDPKGKQDYIGLASAKHFNGQIKTRPQMLDVPLRRRKPTTWFVNSMSDLFHKDVPSEFIDQVFAVMALCPQHTFQVLTKRPERMAEYLSGHQVLWRIWERYGKTRPDELCPPGFAESTRWWPLPNVWLGTSVENQEQADKRIPHLLQTPAAVRFLSCEPLLSEINLTPYLATYFRAEDESEDAPDGAIVNGCERSGDYWTRREFLRWLIVGGESGHHARPLNLAWVRSIVSQCRAGGVPCFVKQLGAMPETDNDGDATNAKSGTRFALNTILLNDKKGGDWNEWPADLRVREYPQ